MRGLAELDSFPFLVGVGVLFGAFFVGVAIAWLIRGYWVGGQRFKTLEELLQTIESVTGLQGEGEYDSDWFPKLSWVRFTGKLQGRRDARIDFFDESVGSSTVTNVRFTVAADDAPDVTITQENVLTKAGKALGLVSEIEIGDAEFDERFLIQTPVPTRVRQALSREVKRDVGRIFNYRGKRLIFKGGSIEVTAPVHSVAPRLYGPMLEALDAMAQTFDRVKIVVRGLGERRALVDPGGKTRCPYCRAGIGGSEEDLVACEKCGTVLHAGCWNEHGGCPILGCRGRDPERARTS